MYSKEIISIINQFSHDAFFHYLVTRHNEMNSRYERCNRKSIKRTR